jgi:hypothetical protein
MAGVVAIAALALFVAPSWFKPESRLERTAEPSRAAVRSIDRDTGNSREKEGDFP